MGKYDDIIDLPHHTSKKRERMSMYNRAAQFAPFSALDGHDEAIAETARHTDSKVILSDYEKEMLSQRLILAYESGQRVEVTYFVADKLKRGGAYRSKADVIRKIEEYDKVIEMADGSRIPITDIIRISFP